MRVDLKRRGSKEWNKLSNRFTFLNNLFPLNQKVSKKIKSTDIREICWQDFSTKTVNKLFSFSRIQNGKAEVVSRQGFSLAEIL